MLLHCEEAYRLLILQSTEEKLLPRAICILPDGLEITEPRRKRQQNTAPNLLLAIRI